MQTWDLIAILPEMILTVAGILVLLIGAFTKDSHGRLAAATTYLGILATAVSVAFQWGRSGPAFSGFFLVDPFSIYFHMLFLVITALVALGSSAYLLQEHLLAAEYYALLLFGTVGMGIMAASNELILVFIGLEISSLASYLLVGFRRDSSTGSEAALKYFLLGSFATAFFLYGIALIFGATGSTRLTGIQTALHGTTFPASLVGLAIALIFMGLAFKVSAAPFQVWTPDVYQGAPSPVTGFLSTGPKAAAFAAFLRIFMAGLGSYADRWSLLLWITAALSMFLGNLSALLQSNIKRMLAYSAIAHAGYVLVAFTTHSQEGVTAVLFYLAAYSIMNIGAFIVVTHIGGPDERYLEIEDYAGLGYRYPVLAGALTVFLLSLIGIPLTAGFFGKFYIFRAAVQGDLIWLSVLGVLNSAIAAYYYLRVLVSMYMSAPTREVPCKPVGAAEGVALVATVAGTFVLGVYPHGVLNLASQAAQWFQQVH
jgi:NADH-quinone oxidoreductase subunit N